MQNRMEGNRKIVLHSIVRLMTKYYRKEEAGEDVQLVQ